MRYVRIVDCSGILYRLWYTNENIEYLNDNNSVILENIWGSV